MEPQEERPGDRIKAAVAEPEKAALCLITELFNANMRLMHAENELENAKSNKKMAQEERDRILHMINYEVPRIRERIKIHEAIEMELPDIVKWKSDLEAAQQSGDTVLGGAEDGAPATPETQTQDLEGPAIVNELKKQLRFGRFLATRVKDGDGQHSKDEYEISCQDCGGTLARVPVEKGADPLVELRVAAKTHLSLFHDREPGLPGQPPPPEGDAS